MKKKTKIILGVCFAFIFIVVGAVCFYYFGDSYPEFYSIATKEFKIPALDTDFVPQGMDYSQNNNFFLIGGYMNGGSPSRIYIINKDTYQSEKYFTLTVDAEPYRGHCGGVATSGNTAWVAGDKYVYRFNLTDAINCESGESIEVIDGFAPGNGADFVLTHNNKLIIGEFYKKDKYDTQPAHHINFSNGEKNYAVSYIYSINQSKAYGIETTTPEAGISMPNQVQGMSFTASGDIILSTSYSIPASNLYIYENALNEEPSLAITLSGQTLPIYVLNNENLIRTIVAPPMSEEIVLVDNKVFILFESDCSKYRLINRERLNHVYSINI